MKLPFRLGKYSVEKLLGSGGMGEVFLARDLETHKPFAIKRIHKGSFREAEIIQKLIHPNIVPIYAVYDDYFVMQYVEGKTLKELLKEKISVRDCMQIFIQICLACQYAESMGIVHSDLKPSNIMVGINNQVTVLDWGVAHEENQKRELLEGTICYMAPEVVDGAAQNSTSELYTLGLILYQMLTLRFPFHRSTVEEYRLRSREELIVDPRRIAPSRAIASHIAEAACFALTKRYRSIEDLLNDLHTPLELAPLHIFLSDKTTYTRLAFWYGRVDCLEHELERVTLLSQTPVECVEECLYSLLALGKYSIVQKWLDRFPLETLDVQAAAKMDWIQEIVKLHRDKTFDITLLNELPGTLGKETLRMVVALLEKAIEIERYDIVYQVAKKWPILPIDTYAIYCLLWEKRFAEAESLLVRYAEESQDRYQQIAFLHGLVKLLNSPEKMAYAASFEKELTENLKSSLFWDKRALYKEAALLYHLIGDHEKSCKYATCQKALAI